MDSNCSKDDLCTATKITTKFQINSSCKFDSTISDSRYNGALSFLFTDVDKSLGVMNSISNKHLDRSNTLCNQEETLPDVELNNSLNQKSLNFLFPKKIKSSIESTEKNIVHTTKVCDTLEIEQIGIDDLEKNNVTNDTFITEIMDSSLQPQKRSYDTIGFVETTQDNIVFSNRNKVPKEYEQLIEDDSILREDSFLKTFYDTMDISLLNEPSLDSTFTFKDLIKVDSLQEVCNYLKLHISLLNIIC